MVHYWIPGQARNDEFQNGWADVLSEFEELAVWRNYLVVGLLAALPWQWAEAVVADAAHAEVRPEVRRIALVIGNGNYPEDLLGNPANDARAMAGTLRSLGFEVVSDENVTWQQMQEALLEFRQRLSAGGVGLFYFSGHGLRAAERTLLLPVDATGRSPARQLANAIDLHDVLESMSLPRPDMLNLLILDTCLNNPFRADGGGGGAGFALLPEQTLIAYATAPGAFAADRARHGLYTEEWLKAMSAPDLDADIEELFGSVQSAVRRASNEQQIPWLASSLSAGPTGFRFLKSAPAPWLSSVEASARDGRILTQHSRGILPKDSAEQYELAFWESIKDSSHASDYEAYLQAYPNGRFAILAQSRIERLRAAAPKAETGQGKPPSPPAAKTPPPERAPAAPAAKAQEERVQRPASAAESERRKSAAAPPAAGELKDCPACPALVVLPEGSFVMGNNASDPSEKPAHQVSIKQRFAIGKYEVSVEQWNACADAGACPRVATHANAPKTAPARDLSWKDALLYVQWLSKISGKSYRLPSEAEWEYAARGGTSTRYWWGEQMRTGNANCKECGEPWRQDVPANIGSFAANPYGLHDMNGSLWEWVGDCWHGSYKGAPTDGQAWEEQNCRARVIRGGSWREGADYMLSSTRFKYDAEVRVSQNGFRVARDIK